MSKKLLGKTDEQIEDLVAALVSGDGNVSWNYDDANGELQIDASPLASDVQSAKSISIDNTDNLLSVQEALAETRFDLGLSKLDYTDGQFETFLNDDELTLSFSSNNFGDDTVIENSNELSNNPYYTMEWAGNGNHLYFKDTDFVYHYEASTAYDITTLSFVGEVDLTNVFGTFDLTAIAVSEDGSVLAAIDGQTESFDKGLIKGEFGTAHDLSTLTNAAETGRDAIPSTSATSLQFAGNGEYLYQYTGNDLYKHSFSTAFDWSTHSYESSATIPQSGDRIKISEDGSELYMLDENEGEIRKSVFETPHNIFSLSYTGTASKVNVSGSNFAWDPTTPTFYIMEIGDNTIYELSYITDEPYSSFGVNGSVSPSRNYDFPSNEDRKKATIGGDNFVSITDDGRYGLVPERAADQILAYKFSSPWGLNGEIGNIANLNVSGNGGNPQWALFNGDGTEIIVYSADDDYLYKYTMSEPYDFSTASYESNNYFGGPYYRSGVWGDGGNILVMASSNNSELMQVELDTPYDIHSNSTTNTVDVSGTASAVMSYTFGPNGERGYMVDEDNQTSYVHEYSLSTPYDITTQTLENTFAPPFNTHEIHLSGNGEKFLTQYNQNLVEIPLQTTNDPTSYDLPPHLKDTNTQGVRRATWAEGGNRLYIVDRDILYHYTASSKYDLSTLTYQNNYDFSAQNDLPYSISVTDGTYFQFSRSGTIYQYTFGTAYDPTTLSYESSYSIGNGISRHQWYNGGSTFIRVYNSSIYRHDASTPYDAATVGSSVESIDLSTLNNAPTSVGGLTVADNGEYAYSLDNDEIYTRYKVDIENLSATKVSGSHNTGFWEGVPISISDNGRQMFTTTEVDDAVVGWDITNIKEGTAVRTDTVNLGFVPENVILSDERGGTLEPQYTIEDENGNAVVVSPNEEGTQMDTSNLTSGTIDITASLDAPSFDIETELDSFATYFN